MRPTRVLYLRNCRGISDVTGGETYLMSLVQGLASHDCKVLVACVVDPKHGETPWLKEAKRCGLPLVTIPVERLWYPHDLFSVVGLIREFDADVIHSFDHRADIVGVAAARMTRRAAVATFMGWTNFVPGTARARLYPLLNRQAMRFVDAIISDSATVGSTVDRGPMGPPMLVIHGGVDLGRFVPDDQARARLRLKWFGDGPVLVFGMVGRIHPVKGQIEFMRAAANIVKSNPHARFVIVGEAPPGYVDYKDSVKRYIEAHGMKDLVRMTKVPREEVPAVMNALDILVAPSFAESFSFSLIEGMALGKPVVTTDVGGSKEMIHHDETGILLQAGDVEGLTASLSGLIQDESRRVQLGRRARAHVEKELSVERMAAKTLNVYREILSWREQGSSGASKAEELRTRLIRAISA
jgi:glycosyltransferase involved in cell wall biosynthesis